MTKTVHYGKINIVQCTRGSNGLRHHSSKVVYAGSNPVGCTRYGRCAGSGRPGLIANQKVLNKGIRVRIPDLPPIKGTYMKIIKLTDSEIGALQNLAAWRAKGKTNISSANLWSKGQSKDRKNLEGHYLGVVGEFVVARLVNGFFDPMPRVTGDKHSADIVSGLSDNSLRISVKTTKYDPPIFKLNKLNEIDDATHCALCLFQEPILTIHWIKTKEDFLESYYTDDFGYGRRYCLGTGQEEEVA